MAVIKQVYSETPGWTAAKAADLLENAFIDSGLMANWYDSFLSGTVENRVLEVVYDVSKTYGKTYYWFMITTASISISVASGWDTAGKVPSGAQYIDYYQTTTNTINNHINFSGALSTGTELQIVRYSSLLNSDISWFVLRNGSNPVPFHITPGSVILANWLDLNKVFFHHFVTPSLGSNSPTFFAYGYASFRSNYILRRSFCCGGSLADSTSLSGYANFIPLGSYTSLGNNLSAAGSNYSSSVYVVNGAIASTTTIAPYGFNDTNSAYSSDYTPVMFGYSLSPYIKTDMPNDMAIAFAYTISALAYGDRIVVSAGSEEWEVLSFVNTTLSRSPAPMLLARVI
jgi:hypothetical protein